MPNVNMVAVDGTDAVAYVIIRPAPDMPGRHSAEAAANGLSKPHAAHYLRLIADQWDPPTTGTDDTAGDAP